MYKLVSVLQLAICLILIGPNGSVAATRTTTAIGGSWNSPGTWSGGVVPAIGDSVVIVAGASVTVTTNSTVQSILFNNANSNPAILTVNSNVVLTVTTSVGLQNGVGRNTAAQVRGSGTLNCASINVGGTTTPTITSSDFTTTLTSTIWNWIVSSNLTISALYNSSRSAANQGAFILGSGRVNVGGSVAFVTVPLFGPTLTLASGTQTGTLILSGRTPITITGGGTSTFNMSDSALVLKIL